MPRNAPLFLTLPWRGRSSAQRAGRGDGLSAAVVFQWFNFSFKRTVQLHINSIDHGWQIASDLGIAEANDTISFLLKPHLPFTISLGGLIVVVMSPIELKDEVFGGQKKSTT
jgi:hypothetical protein